MFWRKGGSAATDMGPLILFLLTKMALAKVPHSYQEAEDFSPEDAEDAGAISEGKVVPKEKVLITFFNLNFPPSSTPSWRKRFPA